MNKNSLHSNTSILENLLFSSIEKFPSIVNNAAVFWPFALSEMFKVIAPTVCGAMSSFFIHTHQHDALARFASLLRSKQEFLFYSSPSSTVAIESCSCTDRIVESKLSSLVASASLFRLIEYLNTLDRFRGGVNVTFANNLFTQVIERLAAAAPKMPRATDAAFSLSIEMLPLVEAQSEISSELVQGLRQSIAAADFSVVQGMGVSREGFQCFVETLSKMLSLPVFASLASSLRSKAEMNHHHQQQHWIITLLQRFPLLIQALARITHLIDTLELLRRLKSSFPTKLKINGCVSTASLQIGRQLTVAIAEVIDYLGENGIMAIRIREGLTRSSSYVHVSYLHPKSF
jgi:hypothetical protein